MEIWKEIKETNYRYSVSNYGRVRKNKETIIRSNGRKQIINEKIMTPIPNNYGYYKVRVRAEFNVTKNMYIHKLVANYFIDGKNNSRNQVNHINGLKNDNNYKNLEWCTLQENITHAWKTGLSKPNGMIKVSVNGIVFNSISEAADFLKLSRNTITFAIRKGYYIDNKYKVIYNGNEFSSIKEASRVTGVNPKYVKRDGEITYPEKIIISEYKLL